MQDKCSIFTHKYVYEIKITNISFVFYASFEMTENKMQNLSKLLFEFLRRSSHKLRRSKLNVLVCILMYTSFVLTCFMVSTLEILI